MHHPTDWIPNTTASVTPVVEHWLEREITQWVHPTKDRSNDPSHHEWTLLPQSYILLLERDRKSERIIIIINIKNIYIFNNTLNTFYLLFYGVRHLVKDHSDSERRNLLLPLQVLFSISSKGSFKCTMPQKKLNIPQLLLYQSWSPGRNVK